MYGHTCARMYWWRSQDNGGSQFSPFMMYVPGIVRLWGKHF